MSERQSDFQQFDNGPVFPERLATFVTFCTFGVALAGGLATVLALL